MLKNDQTDAASIPPRAEARGLWEPVARLWRRSRFANRRRFRRYSVNRAVQIVTDSQTFTCEILNISSGGAVVTPTLPCPIGSAVKMSAQLLPVPLIGTIVSHSTRGTGIQFGSPLTGSFATLWFNSVNSLRDTEPGR